MESSQDYKELEYYFNAWHNKIGGSIKAKDYAELIALNNKLAQASRESYFDD